MRGDRWPAGRVLTAEPGDQGGWMELWRFADAENFLARAEPFLLRREAEHNLILGISARLAQEQSNPWGDGPPYLAAVEDGGGPVAVAVRTPPHNLLLSEAASLDALDLFVQDLKQDGQALPGVTASTAVSLAFAERWRALTGQSYRRAQSLRVYQLDAVRPVAGVPGHLRPATEEDLTLLVDWLQAFGREAHGEADDRSATERSVRRTLAADPSVRGLYVWDDGAPVSLAGHSGSTPNGGRVGPVYTPPALRRRGYASAGVAALSQRLLDSGRRFCFLFTDLANPTSNHVYQTIGYEPVCDFDDYRFG